MSSERLSHEHHTPRDHLSGFHFLMLKCFDRPNTTAKLVHLNGTDMYYDTQRDADGNEITALVLSICYHRGYFDPGNIISITTGWIAIKFTFPSGLCVINWCLTFYFSPSSG